MAVRRVHVVDSHTAGEPTRVVVGGGPDLGSGTLAVRRERFRTQHDDFRRAVVNEPRGSDVIVGALLTGPERPDHAAGVVFFNNVGYLGMCGHGTIGLVATLAHLGRLATAEATFDTPVGPVETRLGPSGDVSLRNVESYRHRKAVPVDVPGYGRIEGDVAWGGNWFFLVEASSIPLLPNRVAELTEYTRAIRAALARDRVRGADGAPIDHIELSGPAERPENSGRNFVLCPGGIYDRSPCGTGTSAKVACLVADGQLAPDETWRQEGILGSVFEATAERIDGVLRPRITGRAYVTGEADLLLDDRDPFCFGIPE